MEDDKDVKVSALCESISAAVPALEARAGSGDLSGALEELAALEKKARAVRLRGAGSRERAPNRVTQRLAPPL